MARGGFDAAEGNFVALIGTNSAVQQTNVLQKQSVDTKKRKSEVPIGRSVACLKLEKTPEFLERLEARLAEEESEWYQRIRKYMHQLESEKLKASNFPARKIHIGNWEREATYDNNIVAKFYFAKKQLVWEVLEHERGRKKKIDFSWSDISAIRATFVEGKASTLHIELENQPKFWLEGPPEPRKHVQWTAIPDFTNGEATKCRRHTLTFAEGIMEKHYEKLVHSSGALFVKNRGPFPMHNSLSFTDQVNESLKNQQDLRYQQYSSTTMCEGMIPTPQHVLIVPPLKQIPPEIPSESFSPSVGSPRLHHSLMIGNMDLPSPDMHYAPMNAHAMPPESVSNFQPTSTSAELNAAMHGSFPRQSNRNLGGRCLTIENQRQEQPMRAYSTPAPNLYPRRVLVDPTTKFRASSIPGSSSLTEVTQGIQTPEGFYLNNGEEYNFGSTNTLVPAGVYNQIEVHGAPAGVGDINIRNDGNVLENQKSLTNINHNDEMPEDNFIFVNNEGDILDMLDLSVDMQINQEPSTKPNLGESSGAGLSE